jgi:hypothetical protein
MGLVKTLVSTVNPEFNRQTLIIVDCIKNIDLKRSYIYLSIINREVYAVLKYRTSRINRFRT